jgi:nucleotide-binding universal stress UspA family protein
MALKAILVHLDHSARSEQRLDLAIALAARHQAHLSGFYASSNPGHTLSASGITAPEMLEQFRQKTAQAGVLADWIDSVAVDPITLPLVDRLILHSYYADLVIVGQPDPSIGSRGLSADFPERIALLAGRPVLVIPRLGEFTNVGERIMVAWRGGRASSRALYDSVPLLRKAHQVSLVLVNPLDMSETEARYLSAYMIRNDIAATCRRVIATDLSAGNILLNQACDLGVDLLVMGLFSVNRRGKVVVGPAGRHLLDAMTVPLLISG